MKYGLIGERLGHSFSKIIHGRLADYEYELCEIAPCDLDEFMRKRDFLGINVTIPYKSAVIPYLDEVEPAALKIGAVNTIVNSGGRLIGYNTDFYGMQQLISHAGVDVCGKKVAILGSGATSRTAQAVLDSLGAGEIVKVGRKVGEGIIDYNMLNNDEELLRLLCTTTTTPESNKTIFNMIWDKLDVDGSAYDIKSQADINTIRTRLAEQGVKFVYYEDNYKDMWE